MTKVSKATKNETATKIRDLAVDIVANHGQMTNLKKGEGTIPMMTYEDSRIAILFKTPRVDLSDPSVPAWVNPKGFGIDIWLDNTKKMSVQWDNDGPIDVLFFKSGDWSVELERLGTHLCGLNSIKRMA
jgi:hypothetical protein